MLEVLEMEYLHTDELDNSLKFFLISHTGKWTGGKMRTAWKHPSEKLHLWPSG